MAKYIDFLHIMNRLMTEKHYDSATAADLASKVFDHVEHDPLHRPVEHFIGLILPLEEYNAEYGL